MARVVKHAAPRAAEHAATRDRSAEHAAARTLDALPTFVGKPFVPLEAELKNPKRHAARHRAQGAPAAPDRARRQRERDRRADEEGVHRSAADAHNSGGGEGGDGVCGVRVSLCALHTCLCPTVK